MSWIWDDSGCLEACSTTVQTRASVWSAGSQDVAGRFAQLASAQPLYAIARDEILLRRVLQHANALAQQSQRLVVVGTGGASLGAQTLGGLAPPPSKLCFLENCDPCTMERMLGLPGEETAWLIVSKSGETVETLTAALAILGTHGAKLKDRVCVVTANEASTLGQLAKTEGWPVLPHPPELGGRFSVFSVVGLLPAAYAGLDIKAIASAAAARAETLLAGDEIFWRQAAWIAAAMPERTQQVLMAYADRLRPATQWWKQLWAESLGKGGLGQTPVTAIGAIDQHSQLQLYLDGPRDKMMTLWLPKTSGAGPQLPKLAIDGLGYLGGHTVGDVMAATAEATVKTLRKAGVPLRVARGELTPVTLAEWMIERMLETVLVAAMIGVDPYSQPAVEEGKILARAALGA